MTERGLSKIDMHTSAFIRSQLYRKPLLGRIRRPLRRAFWADGAANYQILVTSHTSRGGGDRAVRGGG